MKTWIKCLIAGVVGFFGGGVGGWFLRKKTAEVQFEECTEEELQALMAGDEKVEEVPTVDISEESIKRPIDIQQMIDRTFDQGNGLVQMDTQKEQYFQRWKEEEKGNEIAGRYDTRTKEEGEEEEFDEEFLNDIKEAEDELPAHISVADIEPATIEDWNKWASIQDGPYDAIELNWYEEDDVVTDDNNEPIENQEKYVGHDVESYFRDIGNETTDDPDVRIIFNHNPKVKTIYQISRIHASYAKKKEAEEYGGDYDGDDRLEWIRSRNQ